MFVLFVVQRLGKKVVPRLAQSHVCDSVLVAEGKFHVPEGIEGAAIESDVLSQCLEDERALVETGFCFSRHVEGGVVDAFRIS